MKFAITGNVDKAGLPEAIRRLIHELKAAKAEFVIDHALLELLGEKARADFAAYGSDLAKVMSREDILVALGGDGTILHAARLVGSIGTPILGVNLGKLGFLAEIAPQELEYSLRNILAKKYLVEERIVLRASVPKDAGRAFYAVNDIVVDKSPTSRLIDMETYIGGEYAVTYRGDGLIISTPTGSTAYALSNGGPIVIPTSNVIGITPIAPHTLSGRPLIIPDTSSIRVIVPGGHNDVLFAVDGQREVLPGNPVEVVIEKAPYGIRLVRRTDRTYFDVLRAKLFWGKDARSFGEESGM